MNTKELKEKLYRQVENLDYESALQAFYYAAVENPKLNSDILDELTPTQLKRLERSLRFADAAKSIPRDAAMKRVRLLISAYMDMQANPGMLEEPAAEYAISPRLIAANEITPELAERLEISREEISNGEVYTHAEVQQMVKAWRSK
jgi:hypothetical protein